MIRSVEEHQQAVLGLLRYSSSYPADSRTDQDGGGTELPLAAGRGRVLAVDLQAPVSLPPFDNSQMDGYAIHVDDLGPASGTSGRTLRVGAPIPAGIVPPDLVQGSAAPIMTGAMIPGNTGAIVPIERVTPAQFYSAADYEADAELTVDLPETVEFGAYIRRAGSDIPAGTTALAAGTLLGPAQLGLLAACGIATVPVRRQFTVLLLTTGDEVQEPGSTPQPGKIFDANTTLLETALLDAGAAVIRHRLMDDNPTLLREALAAVADSGIHLILTTGGISQGAYEVVKQALANSSVEFLSVSMQPGGPQALGTIGGVPFLGFPGNPVSALVSFEMFLRPALTAVVGVPHPRVVLTAALEEEVSSPEAKHQVRRGWYTPRAAAGEPVGTVRLVGGPGSHLIHALAESNVLVHLPAGTGSLAAGDLVSVWLVDGTHGSPSFGIPAAHPLAVAGPEYP
ncbi:gephyrin-like molybdotransferase Glp [Arthrobacter sp. AET 35A]|uniref:molybdopterin molybdotransferase MoeA n=1 Tax=Arthrobacter sp. AET 35A TaxID=2292643 RepID=UPI00177FEF81|nr:gephyrin-like molybdotransferase Glp [Arthrobacter sp. AET 35A]MBE0011713.1 molybdopterin molybdenumtransferase MoeA [Arthrobacter sp. AET 35A]